MVPEQSTSTLAAELAKLRNDYMLRLPTELAELQVLATRLNGSESDRALLTELHRRLHKLAGVPGVFELTALSTQARQLEYRIKDWLDESLNKVDAQARQTLAIDITALGTITGITAEIRPT